MHEEEILKVKIEDGLLSLTLNHSSTTNPINRSLESAIIKQCQRASEDDAVSVVMITGGIDRSFCAGGDFSEVSKVESEDDVRQWITRTINLYLAILSVPKPTVAEIDLHAIGIGFQMALCCDFRIGSDRCSFAMPELKHGIACTIGSCMLERAFGRLRMQELVIGAATIDAAYAKQLGLLNEIVPPGLLRETSINHCLRLRDYHRTPFSHTKRVMNDGFVNALRDVLEPSIRAHTVAFGQRTAANHFRTVLSR
jgi:carboxymethylproline synthase